MKTGFIAGSLHQFEPGVLNKQKTKCMFPAADYTLTELYSHCATVSKSMQSQLQGI